MSDISNLMAQIGGLRSELAAARLDADSERERCSRLDRENERHAERAREMEQRIATLADSLATTLAACADLRAELSWDRERHDVLAGSLANTLQACADLRAERDALLAQCTVVRDATDPGPTLTAETRAALPLRALLGGGGIPRE